MTTNMKRLSATLSNRMRQTSSAAITTAVELGTVNSNLSITPDSLRTPIPKGDYMVNLMLAGNKQTDTSDGHSHGLTSALRGIQSGDRVLIAWCGNEPVVIAVVVSS